MPRLQAVAPEAATGKTKELLDALQTKYGRVPNLPRTMANSPAVLETYIGFGALDEGALPAALREQIALATQQQDFVSAVSHELKTPLTSIRMYGEILREGWASEEKKKRP